MPYDPILGQQALLANTIRGGLSGLADRPLEKSRLSLAEAQILDQIRRNKAAEERAQTELGLQQAAGTRAETALQDTISRGKLADERAATLSNIQQSEEERAAQAWKSGAAVRALQQKQAKIGLNELANQEALRNQPLTMESLAPMMFGPDASTETVMDFAANKKLQKILQAAGGSYRDGKFLKANGQPATWSDLPNIMAVAEPILQSDADPGHMLTQKIRQYEDLMGKGVPASPEDQAWYDNAKKKQKDPNWLIDQYEKQNDQALQTINQFKARGLPTSTLESNIARRDKKIANLQSTLAERRKHADALELANINSAGAKLGTLAKDSSFLAAVSKMPLDQATNIIRYDRTMADRLRGAAEELKKIDPDNYDLSTPEGQGQMKSDIDTIKKDWGIDSDSLKRSQEATKSSTETNNDPDGIRSLLFK